MKFLDLKCFFDISFGRETSKGIIINSKWMNCKLPFVIVLNHGRLLKAILNPKIYVIPDRKQQQQQQR